MGESDGVRKREKRKVFVEKRKRKLKGQKKCEELREMKRMKKEKKWLVVVGKNEEAGTHLVAKLCVVQASPLNYAQFSHEQYKKNY